MSKGFLNLDGIIADLIGFVETKIELLKIEAKEKLAVTLSKIASVVLIGFFLLLALTFFSIAAAIKLNVMLESTFLGYLIVSGVFLIITFAFYLFSNKKQVYKSLAERIHKTLAQDED